MCNSTFITQMCAGEHMTMPKYEHGKSAKTWVTMETNTCTERHATNDWSPKFVYCTLCSEHDYPRLRA